VRTPTSRPCLPRPSPFWSLDWTGGQRETQPVFGEEEGTRRYYSGQPPESFPGAVLLGNYGRTELTIIPQDDLPPVITHTGGPTENTRQITVGSCLSIPSPTRSFTDGFDTRCYTENGVLPLPLFTIFDVAARTDQVFLANVLRLLFSDPATALATLTITLDPATTITVLPATGVRGRATLCAVGPVFDLVLCEGTTNNLELLEQVVGANVPMLDLGFAAVNLVQNAWRIDLLDHMAAAGVNGTRPIVFAGHSLGGVLCSIIAVQTRLTHPSLDLQLLTFGMPKPGDVRMRFWLQSFKGVHIGNRGDAVPELPPGLPESLVLLPILLPGQLALFNLYRRPHNTLVLEEDGRVVAGDGEQAGIIWLRRMVEDLIGGSLPDLPAVHAMEEYSRRLELLPP